MSKTTWELLGMGIGARSESEQSTMTTTDQRSNRPPATLESIIQSTRLTLIDTMEPSSFILDGQNETTMKEEETSGAAPTNLPLVVPPAPRAAELLFADDNSKRLYWDRSHYDSPASQMKALTKSATLYVGNLAFSTGSRHIRAHFSQLGPVKTVHMGLDRLKKSPCGFCFVVMLYRQDALAAVAHLSGTKLDGRVIRVELDAGFQQGRQYGRGVSGGQVRDDRRQNTMDPARKRSRPINNEPAPFAPQVLPKTEGDNGDMDDDMERASKRQRM